MPTVTVAGANSQIVTLTFDTNANAVLASKLAAAITAGVQGGTIQAASDVNGPPPALPPGTTGAFFQEQSGTTFLPPGYTAVVDTSANAIIFGSGDPNESVLIGAGDPTFIAQGAEGSGTVVAGGGDNRIVIPASVAGGWSINTGNGDDTVLAQGSGNDTINAGGGHNAIQLGSGSDIIQTTGDDTVLAGSGSETITATTGSDVIFAGSGTLFFIASGASTVFAGTGSDTFFGGAGPDEVHGGTGGNNFLFAGTGAATLFGGGDGDQLFAAGSGAQALHAGAGNETLFGGFSSGQDSFFGGTGNASITAGSGTNLFVFTDGDSGGADTIQGFQSGRDLVDLQSYGHNAVRDALRSQTVVGGTSTITLSDHTVITFANAGTLTANDFVTSSGGVAGNVGDPGNNLAGGDGDDGQQGHGHQNMSDMDDHGQIRNSIIGHS
jgi:Ca2+-binding RTX toxin-like protein